MAISVWCKTQSCISTLILYDINIIAHSLAVISDITVANKSIGSRAAETALDRITRTLCRRWAMSLQPLEVWVNFNTVLPGNDVVRSSYISFYPLRRRSYDETRGANAQLCYYFE